jgi:hypothetical protein
MGRQVQLVAITPESVAVGDQKADKYVVTTGDKRTLFFVFKSDDIDDKTFVRVREQIAATMAPEEGTKVIVFVLSASDSFEIHEMETA